MAAQDVPLPPDITAEVAIAHGLQEQILVSKGQLEQLTAVTHLLGTQNAQTSLMKYGGEPKKFQEWVRSLEKYTILVGQPGDGAYKTFALQSAEGPVSDFLVRYYKHNPDANWQTVLQELKLRFADIVDSQHGLQVLRTTKQKPTETVQLYAERLLLVAEAAWPEGNLNEFLIQRQIVDIFIDGLLDNQIARKVLREGPQTVIAAVKIAVDEQNLTKKFNLRNRGYKPVPRTRSDRPQFEQRHETPMEVDTFRGQCYKCHRKGHRAIDCKSKNLFEVGSTRPKITCFRCGQLGHGIRNCKNRGNPETGRCWSCGSKEHIRSKCPVRPPQTNRNMSDSDMAQHQENPNALE